MYKSPGGDNITLLEKSLDEERSLTSCKESMAEKETKRIQKFTDVRRFIELHKITGNYYNWDLSFLSRNKNKFRGILKIFDW